MFGVQVDGATVLGFTLCIRPSLPSILHDVHLQLLHFGETLPLLRNHMVDFIVEVSDLEFCLQVDAIILGSALPIARLLSALAHHNDRSLHGGQA